MEIRKIMVPLDGSTLAERALPFAVKFAKNLNAEILLLRSVKTDLLHQYSDENELQVINNAESYLNEVRKTITGSENSTRIEPEKVKSLVIYKESMHSLPKIATFENADMIVMSTHGRTGLARVLIGSSASSILQHSTLPVVLIRPSELDEDLPLIKTMTDLSNVEMPLGGERIVVTLDGTKEAELALKPAIQLARQLPATIYLLLVVPPFTPIYYADTFTPFQYDQKVDEQQSDSLRENGYEYLGKIQDSLTAEGVKCVKLVREGNAGPIIAGYAQALMATMILMSSHARSNTGRIFLGSVAEEVVRLSNLPVLVVNNHLYTEPNVAANSTASGKVQV